MWDIELNPAFKDFKQSLNADSQDESAKETIGTKNDWYKGSLAYWESQPATIEGVLGGYGKVHHADSGTSGKMIDDFKSVMSGFTSAIDLGAGIGRIAKTTLLPRFKEVDLLEPASI
jgi:hypothetical protein